MKLIIDNGDGTQKVLPLDSFVSGSKDSAAGTKAVRNPQTAPEQKEKLLRQKQRMSREVNSNEEERHNYDAGRTCGTLCGRRVFDSDKTE